MKRSSFVCLVTALMGCGAIASATTVVPPTFDELLSRAETIFVGRAVDTRSEFEYGRSGRSIVTHVTFVVERVLKGRVGLQTELTFLGGRVDDLAMEVADMPQFRVGDRDVLFVSPTVRPVSPLVGFAYGRFRVVARSLRPAQIRCALTTDGRSPA